MCGRLVEFVVKHDLGLLPDPDNALFHDHLRGCPSCRERLRRIRETFRPQAGVECRECEALARLVEGRTHRSTPPHRAA